MNNLTRVFLVLLRMSIGWLFLVEGYEKVRSLDQQSNGWERPFTSAGYLREATGPLASFFHQQAGGHPDDNALAWLTLEDGKASPALAAGWNELVVRYSKYYDFNQEQEAKAQKSREDSLARAAMWLAGKGGAKDVEKADWPTASFRVSQSFPARIETYRKKLAEVKEVQSSLLTAMGRDVAGAKLRALKADAAKLRTELLADLEAPLREELDRLPTSEQKQSGWHKGPFPPPAKSKLLAITDQAVSYGLFGVGAALVIGLFTRLSCVLGALFLISLYLAMPAFPWLPENLKAEGHYLFVTKNLILAIGLFALATTPSGRWLGLDGLIHAINPFRTRTAPQAARGHSSR